MLLFALGLAWLLFHSSASHAEETHSSTQHTLSNAQVLKDLGVEIPISGRIN